jgi:hypothetical protein
MGLYLNGDYEGKVISRVLNGIAFFEKEGFDKLITDISMSFLLLSAFLLTCILENKLTFWFSTLPIVGYLCFANGSYSFSSNMSVVLFVTSFIYWDY